VVRGCGTARYRPVMRLTLLSLPSALPYPQRFFRTIAKACRYRTIARRLHSVCPARVLKVLLFTCNGLDIHGELSQLVVAQDSTRT
jgi:hypothetical protein